MREAPRANGGNDFIKWDDRLFLHWTRQKHETPAALQGRFEESHSHFKENNKNWNIMN